MDSQDDALGYFDQTLQTSDVRALNDILTQAMSRQEHNSAIEGGQLESIANRVVELSKGADETEKFFALAVLARLTAVARGREEIVTAAIPRIELDSYPDIDELGDLKDANWKLYAAQGLRHRTDKAADEYRLVQIFRLNAAGKARQELLHQVLERIGNTAAFLATLAEKGSALSEVTTSTTRRTRVRRICTDLVTILQTWNGPVGADPGSKLAALTDTLVTRRIATESHPDLWAIIDALLEVGSQAIERRFSNALDPASFRVLTHASKAIGLGLWNRFLEQSKHIETMRTLLLETVLILARQSKTDGEYTRLLRTTFNSENDAKTKITEHLSTATDLMPQVLEFWSSLGDKSRAASRTHKQQVGKSEDDRIAQLLLDIERMELGIDRMENQVLTGLQISDPPAAAQVRNTITGYKQIEQHANALARLRKLVTMKIRPGSRIDYNPAHHEMLGGYRPDVNEVKVVRDGVKKHFGGATITIVKPQVKPLD